MENPDELATRGMKMNELIASSLWWEVPIFLHSDVEGWPKTVAVVESSAPAKKEVKSTVEAYIIRELVIEEEFCFRVVF